jgi:quercetin dioxygenase-like cupin family protein
MPGLPNALSNHASTSHPPAENDMSPVKHPVSGPELIFSLPEEMALLKSELRSAPARTAKTLVKEGPVTVTLIGVNPGGSLHSHKADGPITVQVLEGEVEFAIGEATRALPAGTLLALDGGITHAVHSAHGGVFLLTVVNRGEGPR